MVHDGVQGALLDRPVDLTQGLQLASGVAFVCMLFAGTAAAGAVALMPRWLAVLSYLMAAFLLVTTTTQPATLLVYPVWVLTFSFTLVRSARIRAGPTSAAEVLEE